MYPRSYQPFAERDWDDIECSDTCRFALIGLGGFTREWVIPAIEESTYAETSCVVSGTSEKAKAVAADAGAGTALTYDEFTSGVESKTYDAVYIATPNATHLDLTRSAADLGKDVLCEKPMERSAERSRQLVETCERAGVSLMIGYRLHFNPAVRWLRDRIKGGEIGTPILARGNMSQPMFEFMGADPGQWRLDPDLAGGAALIDLGIYPLNTTRFLLGSDPISVHGTTRSPTDAFAAVDEHVAFTVEFDDGVLGSYTASQNAIKGSHLHITGTRGEIRLEPAFFGEGTASIWDGERRTTVEFGDLQEIKNEFDYFASRVQSDQPIEPDGHHGLVDMETIDAIYEAAETRGRSVGG